MNAALPTQSQPARSSVPVESSKPDIWTRLRDFRRTQMEETAALTRKKVDSIDKDYQNLASSFDKLVAAADQADIAHHVHESFPACEQAFRANPPYWANRWITGALIVTGFYIATIGAPVVVRVIALLIALLFTHVMHELLVTSLFVKRLHTLFHVHLYAIYHVDDGEATGLLLDPAGGIRRAVNTRITDAVLGFGPDQVRPQLSIGFERRAGAPESLPGWMFVHIDGASCRLSRTTAPCGPLLHKEQAARAKQIELVARDLVARLNEVDQPVVELPDPDVLRAAWAEVILPPSTLDALVSQQVLFMTGDPACGRGLLLYGPPGTGKTTLARVFAQSSGAEFFLLSESDLKQQNQGASAQAVRSIWERAQSAGRAVIFVDECEGVFGRRGGVESDATSAEIVRSMLPLWDGLPSNSPVLVIGATNRVDLLDPAIRSRFGTAVEIGTPGANERRRMLARSLERMGFDPQLADNEAVARASAGLSGRDLDELSRKLRRDRVAVASPLSVDELVGGMLEGRRSGAVATATSARWATLFAPPDAIEALKDTAFVLTRSEALRERGFALPKGVLLYGPPGTGKTQLARTIANEAGCGFLAASTADLKAGFVGQSGQRVKQLFADARSAAPCILFLDEIDAVAGDRSGDGDSFGHEVLTQMLQEIDGIVDHGGAPVVLLAATNRLEAIDAALLSRFTRKLLIDLPTAEQRVGLGEHLLEATPVTPDARERLKSFLSSASGWSHRDVANLIQRVRDHVLRGLRTANCESFAVLEIGVDHVAAAISEYAS